MEKKIFNTKTLVLMAAFAALLSASAYISIPLPIPGAPHLTFLNFVVLLIAFLFDGIQPALIVLVWLLLGVLGVPVFIGGASGIGYLIAPWGGYTWAFLIIAIIAPLIRGKKYNRLRYTILTIAMAILTDLIGMFYLMIVGNNSIKFGFFYGFLPFLPLDIVKAVVVAQIVPLMKNALSFGKEQNKRNSKS